MESVMSFVKMAVKFLNNSNGGYWRRFEKGFCWLIYNQLLKWNLINLGRYMSLSGLVKWIVCNWFFPPESLISISFIYFMYSWKMSSKNQSFCLATFVSCFWTNTDGFTLGRIPSYRRRGSRDLHSSPHTCLSYLDVWLWTCHLLLWNVNIICYPLLHPTHLQPWLTPLEVERMNLWLHSQ